MAALYLKRALKNISLLLCFCLAACSSTLGSIARQDIYETLPPRSEVPKKIYDDPMKNALEGWRIFGYLTIKGTEQDVLMEAAKRGAEAVVYKETEIARGGRTWKEYNPTAGYWATTSSKLKFSKAYEVSLFRRTEPDPQRALDLFCHSSSDWTNFDYDSDTLQRVLAAGSIDVNYRQKFSDEDKGTTPLYRAVKRAAGQMERERTIGAGARPGFISELLEDVSLLLAAGADPVLPCGTGPEAIPHDLAASALRRSIQRYGDFSSNIAEYANWRHLGAPMSAGHDQAALLDFMALLKKTKAEKPK
jgi:hypothetical protein